MKKLLKTTVFLMLITLALTLTFQSCENNEICHSCESQDYLISNKRLFNTDYIFEKHTDSINRVTIMYAEHNSLNEIKEFLNTININGFSTDFVGVVLYMSENYDENIALEAQTGNVEGIMIYLLDDNIINTKIYQKTDNGMIEHILSNSTTTNTTFGDFYDVHKIIQPQNNHSTIISIIDENLPYLDSNETLLRLRIIDFQHVDDGGANGSCAHWPCFASPSGTCERQVGGNYTCVIQASCKFVQIEHQLTKDSNIPYDFISTGKNLRSFRDHYLKPINGGNEIIETYYQLSKNLPIEKLSVSLSLETLDIIKNHIVPMSINLQNNPNQNNNILISVNDKELIVDYLLRVKNLYDDTTSKVKIDKIISKVEEFTNKSNFYITNNL